MSKWQVAALGALIAAALYGGREAWQRRQRRGVRPTVPHQELIEEDEAARRLGVSVGRLLRMVERGELVPVSAFRPRDITEAVLKSRVRSGRLRHLYQR